VLHMLQPFTALGGAGTAFLIALIFVGALVVTSVTIAGQARERWLVYALAPFIALSHGCLLVAPSVGLELLTYGGYLWFFSLVCMRVLRHVFEEGDVDGNRLYAVCCVYLLAGIAWGFFYAVLETLQPGSFGGSYRAVAGKDVVTPLIYFSFVTLTTLGYGDISPLSGFARAFATLEAALGQIYLTVLVARLLGFHVSMHGSLTGPKGRAPHED
ncbi:MAG: ion channel, partial [Myxococcota bacterium]